MFDNMYSQFEVFTDSITEIINFIDLIMSTTLKKEELIIQK